MMTRDEITDTWRKWFEADFVPSYPMEYRFIEASRLTALPGAVAAVVTWRSSKGRSAAPGRQVLNGTMALPDCEKADESEVRKLYDEMKRGFSAEIAKEMAA